MIEQNKMVQKRNKFISGIQHSTQQLLYYKIYGKQKQKENRKRKEITKMILKRTHKSYIQIINNNINRQKIKIIIKKCMMTVEFSRWNSLFLKAKNFHC